MLYLYTDCDFMQYWLNSHGGEGVGAVWNICGCHTSTRKGKLGISCQTRSVLAGVGK
jgi:hypothetical protein